MEGKTYLSSSQKLKLPKNYKNLNFQKPYKLKLPKTIRT